MKWNKDEKETEMETFTVEREVKPRIYKRK